MHFSFSPADVSIDQIPQCVSPSAEISAHQQSSSRGLFWGTHYVNTGRGWMITADLGELMTAAYQPNKSEVGESLRDVERREHLTFASQLPAVVRSSLTSWSPAAAAQILRLPVAAAPSAPPRTKEAPQFKLCHKKHYIPTENTFRFLKLNWHNDRNEIMELHIWFETGSKCFVSF